ncbi:PTS sugar transporter subunit IIA [Thermanaerovibrio acidaminovorans]|jgi:glucose-specific phosphotransferase system IIA component|uniref:PTS sugar transporter subunit IIA n=1 Tax=Thermanaerovibrio acidaminovorans TaxID=81462 RepID=UPI002490BBCD|nr:PTS glucose transporter subunit IIA [Thermanaerovibrio acidaminovorans]
MISGWFKPRELKILSPFTGTLRPLSEVPDQVFSQRLVGDGLAVEPTQGLVLSPVEGTIEVLMDSGHAFGVRTPDGVEVLIHIGIDTVNLKGEGFEALRRQGDRVSAKEPVIRFHLDLIRQKAPSILSPVVITTGQVVRVLKDPGSSVCAGEEIISYKP